MRGNAWWVNAVVNGECSDGSDAVAYEDGGEIQERGERRRGGGILPSPFLSSSTQQRLRFIGSVLQAESMAVTERVQV